MLAKQIINITPNHVFFVLNSIYYSVQLLTFLFISSIAMPQDIGISSYIIAVSGVFAVVARYGVPVYLVESVSLSSSGFDEEFNNSILFCLTLSLLTTIFLLGAAFFTEYLTVNSGMFLFCAILMIFINPASMILEQGMILEKRTDLLSKNAFLKIFLFPSAAFFTYILTDNFAWSLVLANVSVLSSPLLVSYFQSHPIKRVNFYFVSKSCFIRILRQSFPYFINSLGLILILSIDKIYVAQSFSVEALGSYDLIWKCAILVEFFLLQPANALYARRILDYADKHPIKAPLIISGSAAFFSLAISQIDFSFAQVIWNLFFDKYDFNAGVFKMILCFLFIMFSVNQLRNIMAKRKLRIQSLVSSLLILSPIILGGTLGKFTSLIDVTHFLVVGSLIGLLFNLLSLLKWRNLRAF